MMKFAQIHYSEYGRFWFHVLTKAVDRHTLSCFRSPHNPPPLNTETERPVERQEAVSLGQRLLQRGRKCRRWQIMWLTAQRCSCQSSLSRMTFSERNGQTCDRKVKWMVRKRMIGQLVGSLPLRTTRSHLTHHSMTLKVTPSWRNLPIIKSSYNWQKCSISALFR